MVQSEESNTALLALIPKSEFLSGFSAPFLIGLIKDATQSTDAGLHMLAGLLVAGAVLVLLAKPAAARR